ncbi:MAG: hypothetical protein KUG65_03855 [Sphingomonadaceae bacterium]|nr:hypothetical protein [Sphingomonadaceae bacterium]
MADRFGTVSTCDGQENVTPTIQSLTRHLVTGDVDAALKIGSSDPAARDGKSASTAIAWAQIKEK